MTQGKFNLVTFERDFRNVFCISELFVQILARKKMQRQVTKDICKLFYDYISNWMQDSVYLSQSSKKKY